MKVRSREDWLYIFLMSLLLLTMTGLGFTRYAIYLSPFIAMLVWVVSGKPTLSVSRAVLPFLMLLVLGVISLFNYDFNVFKKTYFVFVYVWIFLLFDFSKIEIDYRKFSLLLVFIMLVRLLSTGKFHGFGQVEFSVMDSASSFESTLAFPIGMVTLYFFIVRRYLWFILMALVSIVALKRVVLLALVVTILAALIPKKIRDKIINPYTITFGLVLAVIIIIQFTQGAFDKLIFEYTGLAPNDLSKGRQVAWRETLEAVGYSFKSFLFYGVGLGKEITAMQDIYDRDRILLHSDLLAIVLEGGYIFFVMFVFLLNRLKSFGERAMALFLSTVLLTDNVLIYQHVMLTYLLLQSSLARQAVAGDRDAGEMLKEKEPDTKDDRILRRVLK